MRVPMMPSAAQDQGATAPIPDGADQEGLGADPVWDERLAADYGRRLWNVGCG